MNLLTFGAIACIVVMLVLCVTGATQLYNQKKQLAEEKTFHTVGCVSKRNLARQYIGYFRDIAVDSHRRALNDLELAKTWDKGGFHVTAHHWRQRAKIDFMDEKHQSEQQRVLRDAFDTSCGPAPTPMPVMQLESFLLLFSVGIADGKPHEAGREQQITHSLAESL